MKKMISFFAAFVATLSVALAATELPRNVYQQHYDYRDFSVLSVSSAFHVEVSFSDAWNVDVQTPDFLEPYLIVELTGDKLQIGVAKLPADIQRKMSDRSDLLQARITMPVLRQLQLSGASTLSTSGKLDLAGEPLRIQLSGARELIWSDIRGQEKLSIQMSGASKADLDMDFPTVDFDLSGASKLRFRGSGDQLFIDCSGASGANIDGGFTQVVSTVSGSSRLNISDDVGQLTLEQSGASKFEINGVTDEASVDLSGVSRCSLTVKQKLHYDITGVSTLRVKDLGATMKGNIDRGSKFENIR